MKKTAAIIFSALILFSVSGCSGKKENGSSDILTESSIADRTTSELSYDPDEEDKLLMSSFGELWMSDTYYIDVSMTVEYDPSAFDEAPEVQSSDESGNGLTTVQYDYIIAVDNTNNTAGLNMISSLGNQCSIVRDHEIYTINYADKTYTRQPYAGDASDFGESYTTGVCLGTINNCTFKNTGTTTYKDKTVTFEKYTLGSTNESSASENSIGLGDVVVTYYFDSNGKPVAEFLQTSKGVTTFEFNVISDKIEVEDVLNIPEGFKDVSDSVTSG
ncbi:MAG: hypothetical protein IJ861_06470 [Clostridia bacterium]|nr:hypothetical protein [Clostridia bacterium]